MDVHDQAKGEKAVRACLIEPLERLGLARPKGTVVARFEDMKRELCARLWRIDEGGLTDLLDWVIQSPAAKENHWPPAALILEKAKSILPPPWPPSERMVRLFNHQIGQQSLREGWAPELFKKYVGETGFPNQFSQQLIQNAAKDAVARFEAIKRDRAAGEDVSERDGRWFDLRAEKIAHCEKIRDFKWEKGAA